jgi:replicative DNA helicase
MKLTKVLRARYQEIKDEREAIKSGKPPSSFIPTRLIEFDKRGGHKRKSIALYASETGGGKSLWAKHLIWAAASSNYRVTYIGMEDPAARFADRVFATGTNINSARLLSGDLDDGEVDQIGIALDEAEEWSENVEFFDGVRTGEEALGLFKKHPGDLEILDYLSAFPHGQHGREREVSGFMWGWTKHCQEEDVAGVALAQLKGDVTKRGLEQAQRSKRFGDGGASAKPDISGFKIYDAEDLAWCTDAGRNAKELAGMSRPGRHYKRLGVADVKDDIMEFTWPKRNWGAEGTFRVGIDLKTARFYDLPEKD